MTGTTPIDTIICGDCLEEMKKLPDGCIDMILCDLPYGTTACKWDHVIPFEPLWKEYKRLIKVRGAIVLTASQPFTSALVMSNPGMFRYCYCWSKIRVTGHLDAKRKPLKEHEDVCVFYDKTATYNPQMVKGSSHVRGPWGKRKNGNSQVYGKFKDDSTRQNISDLYYPTSILEFRAEMQSVHPTQKPVALFEYLINTYTNEGDLVLDNCIGSGTTAVAAKRTGRHFIGIELSPEYCDIARKRVAAVPTRLDRWAEADA
jgi:site-specific DNA-methyltransferase (adenine-specific)